MPTDPAAHGDHAAGPAGGPGPRPVVLGLADARHRRPGHRRWLRLAQQRGSQTARRVGDRGARHAKSSFRAVSHRSRRPTRSRERRHGAATSNSLNSVTAYYTNIAATSSGSTGR